MEPILNKQEIADLLCAIKEGRVTTDASGGEQQGKFATATQINLFHSANRSNSQLRVPNLDIILDSFAQNYSISLTNQLQRTFSITRIGLESGVFHEVMNAQKNTGAIGVLNMEPLKYGSLFILDQQLSFSMIEIMLGASSELDSLKLDRKLTTIELNILKSIITKACDDLSKAMKSLLHIHSTLVKVENNPRLVSITDQDSEVIVGRFKVQMGNLSGELKLLFPVATLEPLRDRLKELLSVKLSKFSEWSELIMDEILEMSVTVVAQSGMISLPLHKIIGLKTGDILPLNYDPNSPLKVLVEDNLKFFARPGVHGGKRAISLTGMAE